MKKRILVSYLLAFFGAWLSLVLLGKEIIPCAPISTAWIAPLGADGWEYAMMRIPKEKMSKSSLSEALGEPNDLSVSGMQKGIKYLHYKNYHDDTRYVSFAVDSDGKVLYAAPSG